MEFNQRGITGTITFTEEGGPTNIRIVADLQGLRGELHCGLFARSLVQWNVVLNGFDHLIQLPLKWVLFSLKMGFVVASIL